MSDIDAEEKLALLNAARELSHYGQIKRNGQNAVSDGELKNSLREDADRAFSLAKSLREMLRRRST